MKGSKLQRILLASLAVNLFFVAMGTARWLRSTPKSVSAELQTDPAAASPSGTEQEGSEANSDGQATGSTGPRAGRERGTGAPSDLVVLRHIAQTMGGRDDPRVREVLQRDRAKVRRLRDEIARRRAEVAAALVAEPFDAARLRQALLELREATSATAEQAAAAVLTLTSQMTQEERRRLRKHVEQGLTPSGLRPPRGPHGPGRGAHGPGRGSQESGRGSQESGRGSQESGRGPQESGRGPQESGRGPQAP